MLFLHPLYESFLQLLFPLKRLLPVKVSHLILPQTSTPPNPCHSPIPYMSLNLRTLRSTTSQNPSLYPTFSILNKRRQYQPLIPSSPFPRTGFVYLEILEQKGGRLQFRPFPRYDGPRLPLGFGERESRQDLQDLRLGCRQTVPI